ALVAAEAARAAGAEVDVIRLSDYALPIFDEDLEKAQGLPAAGAELKRLFREHHGFLVASPEYNSGYSAALKNAIDWVSRPEAGRPELEGFRGKVVGLLAASPGALGASAGSSCSG
ncbi:MAG TPA: NAD(P)H-dependent oxidoreductase, partial [Planctomycetota bacterium]|nr:NAD(P)H-dependent oxidoreductase [Planctomycetota bacterium]